MSRILRGVLTGVDESPVVGATLTLICIESAPGEHHVAKGAEISRVTDSSGRYIFPVVGDGLYRVALSVPGATRVMLGEISVAGEGEIDIQTLLSLSGGTQETLMASIEAAAQNTLLSAVQNAHAAQHEALGIGVTNYRQPGGLAIVGDTRVSRSYNLPVSCDTTDLLYPSFRASSLNMFLHTRTGTPRNKVKVFPDGTMQWSACGGDAGVGEGYGAAVQIDQGGSVWAESESPYLGCGFIIPPDVIASASIDGTEHEVELLDFGSGYSGHSPYYVGAWLTRGAVPITGLYGVPDETTEGLISWMEAVKWHDTFHRRMEVPHRKILLAIGLADMLGIVAGTEGFSIETTKANLDTIVAHFASYAEVVLDTIAGDTITSEQFPVVCAINDHLRGYRKKYKNVKVLDTYSILLDRAYSDGRALPGKLTETWYPLEVSSMLVGRELSKLLIDKDDVVPYYTHPGDLSNVVPNGSLVGTSGGLVTVPGWPTYSPASATGVSAMDYGVIAGEWALTKQACAEGEYAPDWQVAELVTSSANLYEGADGGLLLLHIPITPMPLPEQGEFRATVELMFEWSPDVFACAGMAIVGTIKFMDADTNVVADYNLTSLFLFVQHAIRNNEIIRIESLFPFSAAIPGNPVEANFVLGIFGGQPGTKIYFRSLVVKNNT